MSLSHSPQQRAASTQQDTAGPARATPGAGSASGTGRGRGPRRTNLPFRYSAEGLNKVRPIELQRSLRNSLTSERSQMQDGVELSDTEKVYVVVDRLRRAGVSDRDLHTTVAAIFFDYGRISQGRDRIADITLSPGEVQITFSDNPAPEPSGSPILPMICTAPTKYAGQDTNTRGSIVRRFQDTGAITRRGSWLETQADAVAARFLTTTDADPYKAMSKAAREADPGYRAALWAYEQDLAVDYLIRAKAWVRKEIEPIAGKTPQELLAAALREALDYENPHVCAVPHSEIQTQDEAVAQGVLQDLGIDANVNTDDPAASAATRR